MDKRFSEMTFPEQMNAYESACMEVSRLKAQLGEYSRKMIDAADEIIAWKDASGLERGGDPDGVTPAKAKEFWDKVERERNEAQKELEEWRRAHSQPICNPPEATGEYVDVLGEMTIPFTVQLPVELCREPIACDDPAIEAALQAVSGHICTYIWGEDKKPAVVYCDVGDQNVEIESDDRTCLEKDSTRLTDESVNSGSCNGNELGQKCDQS